MDAACILLPLLCFSSNNLLLFTVGPVWRVCRNRRYRQHCQADVCWHDVLVLSQVQFWTQPAHQGKQTWHTLYNSIYISQLAITGQLLLKQRSQSTHAVCWEMFRCLSICLLFVPTFSAPRVLLLWTLLQGWTN